MKYQTGDTVLLLHSNEEGEVIEILSKTMLLVEVGGVRFPVYMDQVDFPYYKRFTEKKQAPKKEKKYIDDIRKEKATARYKVGDGVWLAFLPVFDKDVFEEDIVESFKLYLINQTQDSLNFSYSVSYQGSPGFELNNQVYPLSDFYLHDIGFEQMNDTPKFSFDFSLLQPDKKRAEHFEASLKLKAKQLFKKIEEIRLSNEPTFSYQLFSAYPDKVKDEHDLSPLSGKYRVYDASRAREHLEAARSVVDLHIEKLSDDWKHLSNFEILTLQLKAFEKYYYLAIAHHQPGLTVIHGVGKGKLREEIHEILKTKSEVKSFVNQYHPLYGYGATEIYFN